MIAYVLCLATPLYPETADRLQTILRDLVGDESGSPLAAIDALEAYPDKAVASAIFEAYRVGALYFWEDRVVMAGEVFEDENYLKQIRPIDIVTKEFVRGPEFSVPLRSVIQISAGRNERQALASAQIAVQLADPTATGRAAAIRRAASDGRAIEFAASLEEIAASDANPNLRFLANESRHIITLTHARSEAERTAAVRQLGELKSLRAQPLLRELAAETGRSSERDAALTAALARIARYRSVVDFIDIVKASVSTGSILILVALGLSITFGLMGVINMAHGEMLMVGAYTTYAIQVLFGHLPDHPVPLFFIVALPVAFIASALVGGMVEWSVVRRLYNRPIESLLATYGVSLILVQIVRLIFGDNRATNSPDWLQGAVQIAQGIAVPVNRIFVLLVAAVCVVSTWMIFRYSRSGMEMKATMQNRGMAAAVGINTCKVDSFTFMLGSGIAGIAGCAVTTLSGITPDMGKNYLVDSFLVVVTGGVGNLGGIVISGAGIGLINKILEGTVFGTVWAKIIVLTLVILFIQYKPRGIFPPKGRTVDE